ncbi:hypothetical protein IHQ73_04245 [Bifidobacterium dentium]|uniref:hypothetical protein n=1 Tax=Bifidobacterium dentium TaxID=1689 RepID=UPI0018B025EE|nr:hypothetical protein [Bifidobacterium dentium]MBF9667222.1 hypothetical protein [Bifidobacterium dentium]
MSSLRFKYLKYAFDMNNTITRSDRQIKAYLDEQFMVYGITGVTLQAALDRSSGYISERVNGKRSWAVSELDRIAPLIHLPNALSIMAMAASYDV